MDVNKIKTIEQAQNWCEGVINDLEGGIIDKDEAMKCMLDYTFRLHQLFYENTIKKVKENPDLLK